MNGHTAYSRFIPRRILMQITDRFVRRSAFAFLGCLLLLMLSLASLPVDAQVTAGLSSISGVVQDPNGAVVPGAKVVVSNPSKGIDISITTSEGGVFNV